MHDEGSNQGGVQGVHKEAGNSGPTLEPDGLVEDSREGFSEVKPVLEGALLPSTDSGKLSNNEEFFSFRTPTSASAERSFNMD